MNCNDEIKRRYDKLVAEQNMGCANLKPFMELRLGLRVLDIGCGSGKMLLSMVESVGSTGVLVGIDMTPGMIVEANCNNSHDNVSYLLADMHNLPFDPASFDLVVSNCVINHAHDKQLVFDQIYKVLAADGSFVVGDVVSVTMIPEDVASNPDNVAACWGGAILKEKYISIVNKAGFLDVEILSSRAYIKNGYELESIIIKGVKK